MVITKRVNRGFCKQRFTSWVVVFMGCFDSFGFLKDHNPIKEHPEITKVWVGSHFHGTRDRNEEVLIIQGESNALWQHRNKTSILSGLQGQTYTWEANTIRTPLSLILIWIYLCFWIVGRTKQLSRHDFALELLIAVLLYLLRFFFVKVQLSLIDIENNALLKHFACSLPALCLLIALTGNMQRYLVTKMILGLIQNCKMQNLGK